MTTIDQMVDLNLKMNNVDPATATADQRQEARKRCEACADALNEPLEVVASSFVAHFKSEAN